jgi:superfamily II DNA or RNA helicase
MEQWRERLANFLDTPPNNIGQVGGGQRKVTGEIDVAVIQSLSRKGEVDDLVADYGQVIVDEAHHLSAFSFERVLKLVKARDVMGLTATPMRKDGHHPIILMQCGPIRYRLTTKEQRKGAAIVHRVVPRVTGFHLP